MRLKNREITALTCPLGQRDILVFDDELPGFALRVTKSGTKVFIFQYRRGRAVRRVRIGRYGDITPAHARKLAVALRGQVAGDRDPVADRRRAATAAEAVAEARKRARRADALTVEKLLLAWDTQRLRHRRPRYRAEATRAVRAGMAELLDRPAHAIDAAAARRVIDAIPSRRQAIEPLGATGETMARRVRSYARAMYGWAVKRGILKANPFGDVHNDSRETPRERVLSDAELGEVWRAAGGLGWPWGPYVRFLVLTLQREAEAAGLRWSELAADLAVWELPGDRTKNGKPHLVHLADLARDILRAAPRLAGSELVFTTTGRTPVSGFSRAKRRLDAAIVAERAELAEAAGANPPPIVPWRFHDIRRTGVTALARLGVRWEVADRLLNHVGGAIRGVAAVYQRHDFMAERKAALDLWAAHILSTGAQR